MVVPTSGVSVVIAAFHRPEPLGALLARLGGVGHELVVVNIENDTRITALAATARATHVPTQENVGYAAAVNVGARAARGDVVVFCNDDIVMAREAISDLAAVLRSGQADVVVPAIVGGDGTVQRTILALPTLGRLISEWLLLPDRPPAVVGARSLGVQKWRRPSTPERVDAVTATTVAVRAEVLRLHTLPEAYFLYWEEAEWFWRLRSAGVTVLYWPLVTVLHDGGRADVRPEKARLLARNAVRCVRRTQGRWRAAVALPIVIAWSLRLLATAIVRRRDVNARWAGFVASVAAVGEVFA